MGNKNEQWSVSFCYETSNEVKTEQELLAEYSELDEKSLRELVVGIDRGIVIPFKTNKQTQFDFDKQTKKKLKTKELRLNKYQKK